MYPMKFIKMLILLAILIAPPAYAGGPFVVDSVNITGAAQRWESDTLEWHVDKGQLSSSVDNATARGWIQEQLAKWTDLTIRNAEGEYVSTAAISTSFQGSVEEDIDETNYTSYISYDDGPTVIIFDDDGDITAALMGEQNRNVVVGLSQPLLSDSTGLRITKGFALFNGLLLSNGVLSSDQGTAEALFKATVLHELGHLLNLDHSQVNFDISRACVRNGTCTDGQYIPTMYPELLTPLQGNLSRDDKITISWIYPASSFTSDFCTITGELFDGSGNPLKGVNVLAVRAGEGDDMAKLDARSFVSGALYPSCEGTSHYYLHGIVPGHSYAVSYEAIGSEFTGASDFEPLDNPPRGFDEGIIYDSSGASTVSCDQGGKTITMASATIDTTNSCTYAGDGGDGDGDASSAAGGCSLMIKTRGSKLRIQDKLEILISRIKALF